MKTSIYCEHPTIIRNKSLWQYKGKYIYTDGVHYYPFTHFPLPSVAHITLANIDNYKLLLSDGEILPLYIAIPCGKCLLCRNKKKAAWVTRCKMESAINPYKGIFVTLTYQDKYLPRYGLEKRHVQLFLKRFRINYERMFGKSLKVRYIACGEYGSDDGYTHRPHYHLYMWGIPYTTSLEQLRAYQAIAKSWSTPCTKEEWNTIPYYFLRYNYEDEYRELFGKIDASLDRGQSSQYVCKYMLKPAIMPTDDDRLFAHLGTPFFLSSRRDGIGMSYIRHNLDEYRSKFLSSIFIDDKEYQMPPSIRNIIYPSISQLIDSNLLFQVARLQTLTQYLQNKINVKFNDNYYSCEHISFEESQVKRERYIYKGLKLLKEFDDIIPYISENYAQDTYKYIKHLKNIPYHAVYLDKSIMAEFASTYLVVKMLVLPIYKSVDITHFVQLKKEYKDRLAYKYRKNKEYDIEEEVNRIKNTLQKDKIRYKLHQ